MASTGQPRTRLSGSRRFTWYSPAGRAPTEYEDLTVHQQSSPLHYAFQGWPIRFDDGRDPYDAATTAMRSSDWYAYRDPNQTIQRTYISSANESEKALERSISGAASAGLFKFVDETWATQVLATHFMTYPFVEYGLFLALCYAQREALSDTTTFSIVFSAADRLRTLQDIVFYSFDLAAAIPGFSDENAQETWATDPIWQGARRAVEALIATDDWMEIVAATNLCFDRLFGELVRVEFFSRFGAAHGDAVTPILIASYEADDARTVRWTKALIAHLLRDPRHGRHNREVLRSWVERWNAISLAAAEAFQPAFDLAPAKPSTFDCALGHVRAKQAALLAEFGPEG
jgi:methane monooxygenase component A beta chain/propane monooxygenase small subunit